MNSQVFELDEALAVLERTPAVLAALLAGLQEGWIQATEGEGTWSPYDVVGHLIHGERTDWVPRARQILVGDNRPFEPFDRTAQFQESAGRSLGELLAELAELRRENLAALAAMRLDEQDLSRQGLHPELGEVTLAQLLATWVVHDLDHVAQISRTLAKRYGEATGPWSAYLSILSDRLRP
ncbi:MAG TPA: DinB family protein [Thermoanaerobaculia bacterium]|nr:DinB family protein [Thermoanaerobaculia bacterium]